jgi:hypothetical protein
VPEDKLRGEHGESPGWRADAVVAPGEGIPRHDEPADSCPDAQEQKQAEHGRMMMLGGCLAMRCYRLGLPQLGQQRAHACTWVRRMRPCLHRYMRVCMHRGMAMGANEGTERGDLRAV